MADERKQLPPWFIGLLLGMAVFALGALIYVTLGYGDDPVIDPGTTGALRALTGL